MKRQTKVFIDRPQTAQMKQQISKKYIQTIVPHELMIQALNMQNKQIYELQARYLALLQQTKTAKLQSEYKQSQKLILKSRQQRKIYERKLFVEQGLKANSIKYHDQFKKKRNLLNEQLEMKLQLLKEMKGHELNIFFNLEEGILDELIEYLSKKQNLQNQKKNQLIKQIQVWKERYETQIVNKKDSSAIVEGQTN